MSETPTNVTPPPDLTYGYVDGRIILAIGDRSDGGRMPDPIPAEGLTVTFTPAATILKVTSPTPATVIKQPIVCDVDANGYLVDGQGARGVWLVTGTYKVTYSHSRAIIPSHDIEVTTGHTEVAPLDLTTAMPPGGPVLTPSEYAELNGRITILEAGGGGGGVTDHGALTGLADDDHPQYALADGTRGSFAAPSHTHTAAQISDSTATGRALLTAADAAAARTTLALGTAATTASTAYATSAQGAKADTALQVATAQPINAQTGAYTLVAGDAGKMVEMNLSAGAALNVPGSTFTQGQRIDVLDVGSGRVTFVGTSGMTLNGVPSLVSSAQWSAFSIFIRSATTAAVIGRLA